MSRALRLAAAALLACTPDTTGEVIGDVDPSSSSSATSEATTGATPTTGAPEPSSSSTGVDPTTGEPGYDPPAPMCGNGYVEADEECDDANADDADGCNAACTVPCGLEREHLELAPSALSIIGGVRVAGAPDGGIVAFGNVQKITLDMEGNQDQDPRQGLVVAYDPAGAKLWERRIGPDDGNLRLAGGAVDAAGDVFAAGSIDGGDGVDIWVSKLAADDGATIWAAVTDGLLADSDDVATGLALTAAGDVLVSGQIYDADKDSDVWLRKLSGASGQTQWTTTWTTPMSGGYSIDVGGPVAIGPDGSVHVLARAYVDYMTADAILLKFGPDGGAPLWTAAPLQGGPAHRHEPRALTLDADGAALTAIHQFTPTLRFWLHKFTPDGAPAWDLDQTDLQTGGSDWTLDGLGLASDGDLLVAGTWTNEDPQADTAWNEVWLARLASDGARRCQISARGVGDDLVPPSLIAADLAGGVDGVALVTGRRDEGDESALWTGLFRPL